jgi:predicted component of type VI protein secretion system
MNYRRINILLALLIACSGTLSAQEGAVSAGEGIPPETREVTEAPQAVSPDPIPGSAESGAPGSSVAASAPPAQDAAPAQTETAAAPRTAPAAESGLASTSPADDERLRSIFIFASAVVLVGALGAILFLLVQRGREASRAKRRYVAEAYLRDLNGATSVSMYKLGSKPVMLGRVGGKDTEFLDYIVVPSATVGRRHALIEFKDFGYWIMDQGSINGTFVNGRPVSSEVRLKHGDRIRLHKLEFEFVMPEVSESSVTVLAHDAARASPASPAAAEPELVLEPEPDVAPAAAGGGVDDSRESIESEEETLLPGASPTPSPACGSDEETLLPAGGTAPTPGSEETLLPVSGTPARTKTPPKPKSDDSDEFFDITRGT